MAKYWKILIKWTNFEHNEHTLLNITLFPRHYNRIFTTYYTSISYTSDIIVIGPYSSNLWFDLLHKLSIKRGLVASFHFFFDSDLHPFINKMYI